MTQHLRPGKVFIPSLLSIITLGVFITSLTEGALIGISTYFLEFGVYTLLTALALVLSVPFSRTDFSLAHFVGMIAFLSLPVSAQPTMTLATFIGALVGGVIYVYRWSHSEERWQRRTTPGTTIFLVARLTLSFYIAGELYAGIGGTLPLTRESINDSINGLVLLTYAFIYLSTYVSIFALQLYHQGLNWVRIFEQHALTLLVVLLLPVPFSILVADTARSSVSMLYFTLSIVGGTLIISGLYILSMAEQRIRRQLEDLQTLSSTSNVMSGTLDLDRLLRDTYQGVSDLLGINTFTVALLEGASESMVYPLVIERGKERGINPTDALPDYPLIHYVIQNAQPLLLREDVSVQAHRLGLVAPQLPAQSWLGVPILAGGQTLGAIVVTSLDVERRFNDEDLRLLNILVSSAGIAIENARLYSQQRLRAEQLAMLSQVSSLLTETLAPGEVLDTIVSSASMIANATAIAVYLYWDESSSTLALVRSAGLSDVFINDPPIPALGQSDNRADTRPVVVRNIFQREDAGTLRQLMAHENKSAWVELPLSIAGRRQGIIVLYFDEPQHLPAEQLDLMLAFATQATQAINNARTFTSTDEALEQRVEQLFALAALGRLLNSIMETDKIYAVILAYATDVTQSHRGAVLLVDANGALEVRNQRGFPEGHLAQSDALQMDLVEEILSTGTVFRSGNTHQDAAYVSGISSTRSVMMVPIAKGREVLGIILLESDNLNAFSEADLHFVAQIANQTVIAVDNTLLFERVREAHDNMQVILDAMEEGIILIDSKLRVALANPRADLIGIEPSDILGKYVPDLIDEKNLNFNLQLGFNNSDTLQKLLTQVKSPSNWVTQAPHAYEIHGEHGVRYIQRQIIPVRGEPGRMAGILLVFYNKSEEVELMRARESFSQMIVHDLRSPLTAVTTSMRLLQELVPPNSDYQAIVEKTTDASRRAIRKVLNRVDALLDIYKIESGELYLNREPTNLDYLVTSAHTELEPLAHELEIGIDIALDAGLPLLDVDADKIERVLLNLLDNALKYSPSGATIRVEAVFDEEKMLKVSVIDRGPGVPDEYKRRLFERFMQIEGRQIVRRGVGLGLAFCKLVTEAHGGRIWVEDNPEGGSIFSFTIPVIHIRALSE